MDPKGIIRGDQGVVCVRDHIQIGNETFNQLVSEKQTFKSVECGGCGSTINVSRGGIDNWAIQIFPPSLRLERRG